MASKDSSINGYINRQLSVKMKRLYLHAETADVFFVFENEVVPAHKNLLAIGSDVFFTMFYGSLKENKEIVIVDATISAFKEFLQFFYLSRVKLTMENICDVMNLGEKYDVTICQLTCEKFLKEMLNVDNVCVAYNLAILFEFDDLRQFCVEKITANADRIFQTSAFLDCSKSVLSHILTLDTLTCPEIEVFHACMAWVRNAANQDVITKEHIQSSMGDLFYEIRFGAMTIEEFASLSPMYGQLFSFDEYQDIVQMIVSKQFQSNFFKNQSRQIHWNSDAIIECDRSMNEPIENVYLRYTETTTFITNTLLLLGELVFSPLYLRKELPIEVTIYEVAADGMSNILCVQQTELRTVNIGSYALSLAKPVMIKPGMKYKIQFDRGFPNSKGRKLRSHVQIDSNINIQFTGSAGPILRFRFNRIPTEFKRQENAMEI